MQPPKGLPHHHCRPLLHELQGARLVLVEGREQPDPHKQLEAWAQAAWEVVIAAVLLPADEEGRLCLMHDDLQPWVDLLQGLNRAHMVQMGVSHCIQKLFVTAETAAQACVQAAGQPQQLDTSPSPVHGAPMIVRNDIYYFQGFFCSHMVQHASFITFRQHAGCHSMPMTSPTVQA